VSVVDINAPTAGDEAEVSLHASWGRRFVAWLIDGVLVWLALGIAVEVFRGGGAAESWVASLVLAIGVPAFYFTLCHGSQSGQTLGKRILGIAVRDQASLGQLGFPRAFGRWAITFFFWCLFGIGGVVDGLWALGDRRRRTWHDKVAGSVVVRL
jgi:uncharacterized RDD family membrane protein YckC